MIYEVMQHVRNFFLTGIYKDDNFIIENGTVALPFVKSGQYVLIEGSAFNDGVYKYPLTQLTDEAFTGRIAILNPSTAFLSLCTEIESFVGNDNTCTNAYSSESFGGYSYTRLTNRNGGVAGWQDVFASRLNAYRKL